MDLNLAHITVTEVFKGFSLREEFTDQNQILMANLDVHKVAMYSDSRGKFPVTVHDFTAVVLFLGGHLYAVRLRDNYWRYIEFGRVSRFDDLLNFRGEILVLDRKGRLYRFGCTTFSYVCIVTHPPPCHALAKTRKHLVELGGELFLVNFVARRFRVYRMNREAGLWTEVYSLGEDNILFVGPECCFSALVASFPGCRGNTIVYHVDAFRQHGRFYHPLFSMYNNPDWHLFFSVYHMGNPFEEEILSLAGHTDFVWPPPAWLRHPDHHPPKAATGVKISSEEVPETTVSMVDSQDSKAPT